jgi:hypothetical protein
MSSTRWRKSWKMKHCKPLLFPFLMLKWFKENKEIIVDGKLFDIKSVVFQDGIASFTGLYDDQEMYIKLQLENLDLEDDENAKNESANI